MPGRRGRRLDGRHPSREQRIREGEIPGALILERNHLEWRLHPASDARHALAAAGRCWIVFCSEGYTSSLAAQALGSLGVPATDLVGGFHAWQAAGLPTIPGGTPAEQVAPLHRWIGNPLPPLRQP